jgi:hypothetical protein
MQQTLSNADSIVGGGLAPTSFAPPTGCITDAAVQAAAGIQASKLQHQHQHTKGQDGAAVAAVFRQQLHTVRGATASVTDFNVGAVVAALGNATATLDLQSGGVSILTGTITLDSTTAAYVLKAGALAAAASTLVAGNVIELVCTAVNAGTGTLAKGLFGEVNMREAAQ